MLLADDVRVEDAARGVERIDGGIDAELGDLAGEDGRRIEMRERARRCRVGEVIRRDVDGLDGGDGAVLRRGDALLERADVRGERRLVADGRRHAAEQSRDLGARLDEAEDVVDEEQHVLMLDIAEILRHREARERDAHTGSWRLVHLAVDERRLVDDAGLGHLAPEVVALTRALANAGEDGIAAVLGRDVVDELHDEDRLADAGAAEKARLAAAGVRSDEVDDLDARLEDARRRLLLVELRRGAVDRPELLVADRCGVVVDRLAEHVEHAAEALGADRHHDRMARVLSLHAAREAVGGAHGDAARDAVTEMLHDLDDEVDLDVLAYRPLDGDGVEDGRQFAGREFNIYDRSDDLYNLTFCQWETS